MILDTGVFNAKVQNHNMFTLTLYHHFQNFVAAAWARAAKRRQGPCRGGRRFRGPGPRIRLVKTMLNETAIDVRMPDHIISIVVPYDFHVLFTSLGPGPGPNMDKQCEHHMKEMCK